MNINDARVNMLKQQLRTWHVLDPHIIELIENTPREQFVPKGYERLAFADAPIPVGNGRSMMPPKEEGRIVQELNIQPSDKVLLFGVDGGYLMTLLAKLARQLVVAEPEDDFIANAQSKIQNLGLSNVSLLKADLYGGWQDQAPFDVIVLSGSVMSVPEDLSQHLDIGGRLFAVTGDLPVMEATFFERNGQGKLTQRRLYETVRPRLPNYKEPSGFTF